MGPGRAGRGAGDQEPRGPADARREGAAREGADRAHGHPGREPPRRPLVALRLRQPRAAGDGQRVHCVHPPAGRPGARGLRPAARPGAPLHPAPPQDRPPRDLGPARQDGGERLLRPLAQAGGALPGRGGRPARGPRRGRGGHRTARRGAGLAGALQADLQPPLPAARRRGICRGGQRQVGAPARDRGGGVVAAGEDAGVHAVPGGDSPLGRIPRHAVRSRGPGAPRRHAGAGAPPPRGALPERRGRCRSSCSRSRPAARA